MTVERIGIVALVVAPLVFLSVMTMLLVAGTKTCIRYGDERLSHFQQVGSVMVPIHVRECMERGE